MNQFSTAPAIPFISLHSRAHSHCKAHDLAQMRLHEAAWLFAEEHGNLHTREYSKKRKDWSHSIRTDKDSKWLRGCGGLRIRRAWLDLSPARRAELMRATPDDTFPVGSNGVIDERMRAVQDSDQGRALSTRASTIEIKHSDHDLQIKLAALNTARANYHSVMCKESRLRLHAEYNRGSLSGVMEATIRSVQNAVQLARTQDHAKTPDEAFVAVCNRLTDVFTTVLGAAQFPPELDYCNDAPSESFATARIDEARDTYLQRVREAIDEYGRLGKVEDPDASILDASHLFFGKPKGFPSLAK